MATPGARVVSQMGRLIGEMNKAPQLAVKQAALEAKRIHLAEIRSASGGDLRLSGVGRQGARVGVRFAVGRGTGTSSLAFVQATGPVHLLEHKSQAHTIIPGSIGKNPSRTKAGRRQAKQELYDALFGGSYRGARPLRLPWGPRYRVNHPGVQRPKRPWAKAKPRAAAAVTRIVQRQYGAAFARGVR